MKTIDNQGLQQISKIIVERISTSSIYCFGERKQVQAIENPFQEFVCSHKEQSHFYLMVLTDDYIINAVADISDTIKTKTDGRYTVTLIFYKVKHSHYLPKNQHYFYYQIIAKGYKVYEREDNPVTVSIEQIPLRNIDAVGMYWNDRKKIAGQYMESEHQIDYNDTAFVQEQMLHTAVEQISLGLINVFLGYLPDHFALSYLFELCEIFTPLTSDIFPQATSEDKRLFDLLKRHPSSLRWSRVKESSLLDTEHLERRCQMFYDKACQIAEAEINRIKLSANEQAKTNT